MGNGENKESKESQANKKSKENKMGVMPVKKLIINMSVPMMISMLVQALYNVVDSIFVAKLSEGALTAVTLAFPMQNLIISVAAGTGVGINSLLSRSLGEKRFDRADKAADNGIFLAILSALVTLVLGFTVVRPFIASQTSDPEILEYGCQYLGIVMTISAGAYFQVTFERLLQSTGLTMYSMVSQLTGAVVNIIMDPIMIFGLLGCPAMGVAGAAYATVLGQCIAAVVGLVLNLRYNREIHLSFAGIFHPEAEIIGQIYYVGIPSVLMMSIGSVMTYFMNRILGQFSSTATAVFGVYFKLQSFFFMPVFGLNNGLIPVVAYNYGAKSRPRIDEAIRFAVKLAVAIMLCGTFVMSVQRIGHHEEYGNSGAPHHRHSFPDRGLRYRHGLAVPGARTELLFADHFSCKTADCAHSGRLSSVTDRQCQPGVVVLPDRGDSFVYADPALLPESVPAGCGAAWSSLLNDDAASKSINVSAKTREKVKEKGTGKRHREKVQGKGTEKRHRGKDHEQLSF